jgi:hypothetical protein
MPSMETYNIPAMVVWVYGELGKVDSASYIAGYF